MSKKIMTCILLLCLFVTLLPSCAAKKEISKSFYFMDTVITVTLLDVTEKKAEPVFSDCNQILMELDLLWARQKKESDAAKINASASGDVPLDDRTILLLQKALTVTEVSDGAFDITVAPLVDLWKSCEQAERLPTSLELSEVCAKIGKNNLYFEGNTLKKSSSEVQIDLGGIGKGAAIEYLIAYLQSCDLQGGIVSFGSNVAVFGEKRDGSPFRIGIRDPKDPNATVGSVTLKNGEILSVSGDYERYVTIDGVRYHHILNPQNGYPASTGLSSVVVICTDGAYADALSTALFVMGVERSVALYQAATFDFEAIFIASDGRIKTTNGLLDANFY